MLECFSILNDELLKQLRNLEGTERKREEIRMRLVEWGRLRMGAIG